MEMLKYKDLRFPTYQNKKEVGCGLNVEDLIWAGILTGTNMLFAGRPGEGKTQLMYDIKNLFGDGVVVRAHPEVDIYNEILKKFNIEKGKVEANAEVLNLPVYCVDEINRAPEVAQNQFLGLGDGILEIAGKEYKIGKKLDKEVYKLTIATANTGNGEYGGTFNMDKALKDRITLLFDFTHPLLEVDDETDIKATMGDYTGQVKIKDVNKGNLAEKIYEAYKEIIHLTQNFPEEGELALKFLRKGLKRCVNNFYKTKTANTFPIKCQDCGRYNELCSLTLPLTGRVEREIKRYAAGLYYIGVLKYGNDFKVPISDLVFLAYKFAGQGKGLTNYIILQNEYENDELRMLNDIGEKVKKEFDERLPYLMLAVEAAKKDGKIVTEFYEKDGEIYLPHEIEPIKNKIEFNKIKPFETTDDLYLDWFKDYLKVVAEKAKNKR